MKKIINPFHEIIEWLRSEEGEQWSEEQMKTARYRCTLDNGTEIYEATLVNYGWEYGPVYLAGVLSIKE